MGKRTPEGEQTGPPERRQEWSWRPSSGEGSASALHKLKRMERVKRAWREVRGSHPKRDDGPTSAQ